jgi:hypothetical protein
LKEPVTQRPVEERHSEMIQKAERDIRREKLKAISERYKSKYSAKR